MFICLKLANIDWWILRRLHNCIRCLTSLCYVYNCFFLWNLSFYTFSSFLFFFWLCTTLALDNHGVSLTVASLLFSSSAVRKLSIISIATDSQVTFGIALGLMSIHALSFAHVSSVQFKILVLFTLGFHLFQFINCEKPPFLINFLQWRKICTLLLTKVIKISPFTMIFNGTSKVVIVPLHNTS